MPGQDQRQPPTPASRLFNELFETPERLRVQVMPIVNEERNGLLAAAHHFHERPLALFWFAGQVTVFVRGQIVIQGQFEGTQRHPWDIEHERFGYLDLAFMP